MERLQQLGKQKANSSERMRRWKELFGEAVDALSVLAEVEKEILEDGDVKAFVVEEEALIAREGV